MWVASQQNPGVKELKVIKLWHRFCAFLLSGIQEWRSVPHVQCGDLQGLSLLEQQAQQYAALQQQQPAQQAQAQQQQQSQQQWQQAHASTNPWMWGQAGVSGAWCSCAGGGSSGARPTTCCPSRLTEVLLLPQVFGCGAAHHCHPHTQGRNGVTLCRKYLDH